MGIKGLFEFLRKYPKTSTSVHISQYNGKKVAMDISGYLYRYLAAMGPNWKRGIVGMISSLRNNNIHLVIVFDDKSAAPIEKQKTWNERAKRKNDIKTRIADLQDSLLEFKKSGIVSELLKKLMVEHRSKSLLLPDGGDENTVNIPYVNSVLEKLMKQTVYMKKEDMDWVKELTTIFGIPSMTAIGEAEECCSALCRDGIVDAVLSNDSDCIALKCPVLLNKFEKGVVEQFIYTDILRELQFTETQLTDFCILSGTDYNENCKGVGPAAIYKGFKSGKTAEEIINDRPDKEVVELDKTRELFNCGLELPESLPYCLPLSSIQDQIQRWCSENGFYTKITPVEIDIQDDDKITMCYTDGACKNNGAEDAIGGVGVFFGNGDKRNLSCKFDGVQTNNRAELYAILKALELCKTDIHIITDSLLSINVITGVWEASKNLDLIQKIKELSIGRIVNYEHCSGHAGVYGNEEADKLAVKATN